jgi:hypothetical protein
MRQKTLSIPFFKGLALARPLAVCVLDGTGSWNRKDDLGWNHVDENEGSR